LSYTVELKDGSVDDALDDVAAVKIQLLTIEAELADFSFGLTRFIM
jgi:hypothetical protein